MTGLYERSCAYSIDREDLKHGAEISYADLMRSGVTTLVDISVVSGISGPARSVGGSAFAESMLVQLLIVIERRPDGSTACTFTTRTAATATARRVATRSSPGS